VLIFSFSFYFISLAMFFIFFFLVYRKKGYNGSFSLLIQIEENKGEFVGMLPKTLWEAAHLAT
jgi:hypothetical protein